LSLSLARALCQLHESAIGLAPDEWRLVASAPFANIEMTAESALWTEHDCPALSANTGWNDVRLFGGPILDHDRLRHHAAEVGAAQRSRVHRLRTGPLRAGFEDIKQSLAEAYALLSAEERSRRNAIPAEEWLIDNAYVVARQLREIEDGLPRGYLVQLPRVAAGEMAGYPRVYVACLDYLRHTDTRLDPESLVAYVAGYQTTAPLTIGELWAVPIMLRLGLLLVVSGVATIVAQDTAHARAQKWADLLIQEPTGVLVPLDDESVDASFLVELLRLLREHDAAPSTVEWIRAKAASLGGTPEELGRRLHLQRAADQVSIGNAITSMRTIDTYEWRKFFERTSVVEAALRNDLDGTYAATDARCRNRYRRVVERIALQSDMSELAVARVAIGLAGRYREGAQAQTGYYLERQGQGELERACRARLRPREWVARGLVEHPQAFYFASFAVLTFGLLVALWIVLRDTESSIASAVLVTASLLIAGTEVALSVVATLVVALLSPRLLSRFSFENGIPDVHRTMVVVPALLASAHVVERLIERLEILALANPDANLHFALLSDFCDADQLEAAEDATLEDLAATGIKRLNDRHPLKAGLPKFALFHRGRVLNPQEGCFMGWERKRGKLEELNRLILGAKGTTFTRVTAPKALVESTKYVITLDADTELPRAAAMRLVATIAHPLNRPVLNSGGTRVVQGYGVVQPRVGTAPESSRRSRYARIAAGPPGIDPYTTAVSDVYQDLFGEGSYIGKAIYDVRAVASVHMGRIPDNRLLSHDLFEGIFARTALASDIELLDEQPSSYGVVARREHRWIRGDWQLLHFLGARVEKKDGTTVPNDLPLLGFWKILDNLRRSLLAPSLVGAFVLACVALPRVAPRVAAIEALVLVMPLARSLFASLFRMTRGPTVHDSIWGDFKTRGVNAALGFVLLFDQAVLSVDAIAKTLFRLLISKHNLLEWHSTGLDRSAREPPQRMRLEVPFVVATGFLVAATHGRLPLALPVLAVWALAPGVTWWLGRPRKSVDYASRLTGQDVRVLRRTARKTWQFFETFVTADDHWLPPDNFQEEPIGVVAHRTSPTNIGLYLLSAVAARDLGYISSRDLACRIRDTLDTLERMEQTEGHILNWYDTKTLKPLEPRYVSTVDSGNLAAYLWTLRQACEELASRSVVGPEAVDAVADALGLAGADPAYDPGVRHLQATLAWLDAASLEPGCESKGEWYERAEDTRRRWREEVAALAPHLSWLRGVPGSVSSLPGFARLRGVLESDVSLTAIATKDGYAKSAAEQLAVLVCDDSGRTWLDGLIERLDAAGLACGALSNDLDRLGRRAEALADAMNFTFLFDADRSLFSVGYNDATARLDPARYDLLASEARLASLLAIAKGDVPEKHWFHLGRSRCRLPSRAALLSWSGSMFEYLMPLLVLRSHRDTLLDETHTASVEVHRTEGKRLGVPWGVSEAAYNVMDLAMTYQYRAFGIQALGLKPGLDDDLVIAPYATALAAMVRPDYAIANLRTLVREGLDGAYGFYDSIDYTASRVPPNRRGVVVKTYMAHHQGMALVALTNVLLGSPMQRRFHANPRVKAVELLLEERIPAGAALLEPQVARAPAPAPAGEDLSAVEHVGLEKQGLTRAHLLGHGDLATIVTSAGTGVTTWRDLDISRFREDARLEPCGTFVYVRNRSIDHSWSCGFEPTRVAPSSYRVTFSVHHVEIHRRDGDIETTTEVVVSPEHCVEVRRMALTNHGRVPCEIDITSYTEVVLATRAADVTHRAFSNMFIEVEERAELGALFATRRLRSGADSQPWTVQMLVPESGAWGPSQCSSSRARFVGRGRDLAQPEGLRRDELSGVDRHPLDPALILRRTVTIEPQATARIALITGAAPSHAEALSLAQSYGSAAQVDRTFGLAWADARVELEHLGIGATTSFRFQRLLSFLIDPQPSLRTPADASGLGGDGRAALWSQGISGDLPLMVVRVDDGAVTALCREVLLAHEFLRLNNFSLDLLFWDEEPAGYLQPLQDELLSLVQSGFAQARVDQRGGVFVRRATRVDERERPLVLAAARVVLRTSEGSMARQLRAALPEATPPKPPRTFRPETRPLPTGKLLLDNGTGGFTEDGRDYVIHGATPAPWCNVMANPHFGTMVSETGGGFTWSKNSQMHRLTPWSNDAVTDCAGEAIYLRDVAGFVWRATDGTARHSASSSSFGGVTRGIRHEVTIFVSPDDPVKVSRLVLENMDDTPKRLTVYGYVEWVLGSSRESSRLTTTTAWESRLETAFAQNRYGPACNRCSFFRSTARIASATCDRSEFFADFSTRAHPRGVDGALSGASGANLDPCAALEVPVSIPARGTVVLAFILGDADDDAQARGLAHEWASMARVDEGLARSRSRWDEVLGAIEIETPDQGLNFLVNRWLLHQVLSCRVWGRSAFYQSGGAFGFRDQLQDVLALVYANPQVARDHLLRAASRQFEEGDVQHWWHPDGGEGVRTHCSDDMLWLPFAVVEYVRVTQDRGILDVEVPFLVERPVPPGRSDVFGAPRVSNHSSSLYDHCALAIDVGLTRGAHGLPLMRGGDWNDGMDRVGESGRGESVWLGWFLCVVMRDFAVLAASRGDTTRAQRLVDERDRLAAAIEDSAWDGAWYRRAFFDDGSPLGSESSSECRIDAIAQSWAVIAGAGDAERAKEAMAQAEAQLIKTNPPMMMLLTPPFNGQGSDPGYIRAYPPGVRENGGQYTHGVLWTVQALAMLGEGDRAYALLSKINPMNQALSRSDVKRYAVEPYVVAADVYSCASHDGRGGWTWYTGAAGWMYRIAIEWILGLQVRGESLSLRPCVPSTWDRYSMRFRHKSATYDIEVNPGPNLEVHVDDVPMRDGLVALLDDGKVHRVFVSPASKAFCKAP
jgi:cyclic beta-1,2-glucan synthetase